MNFKSNISAKQCEQPILQLIQPERNQLVFHPLDLNAWVDDFRPVNSDVRCLSDGEQYV
jgi:hypothetical protein